MSIEQVDVESDRAIEATVDAPKKDVCPKADAMRVVEDSRG